MISLRPQAPRSTAAQPDGGRARPEGGSGQSRPRSAGGVSPSQMTAAAAAGAVARTAVEDSESESEPGVSCSLEPSFVGMLTNRYDTLWGQRSL